MGLGTFFGVGKAKAGNFTSGSDINKQEDLYNRYNINSAVGSRNFTTDSSGRTTLNINETPNQRAIRELQEGLALDTLGSRTYGAQDFQNLSDQARNATYNSAYNLLSPDIEKERTALETSLVNRGINPGTEAYSRAFSDFDRNKSNQLNQLSLQSVLAGAQERDNLIRNSELTRAARLAEAGGATAGLDYGMFSNVAGINAGGNILGSEQAQNAYNLSRFNDQQQRIAGLWSGAISGGSKIAASGGGGGK